MPGAFFGDPEGWRVEVTKELWKVPGVFFGDPEGRWWEAQEKPQFFITNTARNRAGSLLITTDRHNQARVVSVLI